MARGGKDAAKAGRLGGRCPGCLVSAGVSSRTHLRWPTSASASRNHRNKGRNFQNINGKVRPPVPRMGRSVGRTGFHGWSFWWNGGAGRRFCRYVRENPVVFSSCWCRTGIPCPRSWCFVGRGELFEGRFPPQRSLHPFFLRFRVPAALRLSGADGPQLRIGLKVSNGLPRPLVALPALFQRSGLPLLSLSELFQRSGEPGLPSGGRAGGKAQAGIHFRRQAPEHRASPASVQRVRH